MPVYFKATDTLAVEQADPVLTNIGLFAKIVAGFANIMFNLLIVKELEADSKYSNYLLFVMPLPPTHDLQKHITQTYNTLRLGIGVIAVVFPLVLWLGGLMIFDMEMQGSLSAYYHFPMRNVFVGVLITVGSFLYLYKGFSKKENYALNAAGILAVGVALLPTSLPLPEEVLPETYALINAEAFTSPYFHGSCAIAFFILIAYVCIFRSKDTLDKFTADEESKNRYMRTYKVIGVLMIALPLLTFVMAEFLQPESKVVIFAVEAVAVWVFGAFWVTKSFELKRQTESVEYEVFASTE
ncbi:MAG: hypothetical protein AB8G77_21235 [Rhodothermales bacterium]